jgi:UDP-glucose 4-epimerase
MMKILVTGGAGFIGSHVADLFIKEGHAVVIVDNLSSGKIENVNPAATFYKVDILGPEIGEIIQREQPELISHFAAQISVSYSVKNPIFDMEVNIRGTLNLLENCVRYGVKKFIFASTGGALYGELEYIPADEGHPVRPLSPYAIAKFSAEKYLFYYHRVYGLNYISLRYSNVYGPRQDPHGEAGVVAIFTQRMLRGEQPIINGDGEQTRDYIFVSDVARANILAMNSPRNGEYNIATGKETSVNEIFRVLKELTQSQVSEVHGKPMKGEPLRSVLSWEKAARELGFKPAVSLKDGMKETVAFFRASTSTARNSSG